MGNLLRTEWYKLRKDRSFQFLTWMLIAVSVLFPLLEFNGGAPGLPTVKEYYLDNVLGVHSNIVKLLPSILAGFFITSEYSIGTMKSIASSGHSRFSIYFAKLAVFSAGSAIISVILPIVMTGACAIYFGFHDMPDGMFYFQTVGLIMLYAAAFASLMAIIAIMFTESGKTIGFLLLFFMLADWLLQVLAAKIPFFEPILNHSIFKLIYDIVIVNQLESRDVTIMVVVPILTFLAFGLLGSIIYRKKEIK
jgi:ABC-2 type transport system permease protein